MQLTRRGHRPGHQGVLLPDKQPGLGGRGHGAQGDLADVRSVPVTNCEVQEPAQRFLSTFPLAESSDCNYTSTTPEVSGGTTTTTAIQTTGGGGGDTSTTEAAAAATTEGDGGSSGAVDARFLSSGRRMLVMTLLGARLMWRWQDCVHVVGNH